MCDDWARSRAARRARWTTGPVVLLKSSVGPESGVRFSLGGSSSTGVTGSGVRSGITVSLSGMVVRPASKPPGEVAGSKGASSGSAAGVRLRNPSSAGVPEREGNDRVRAGDSESIGSVRVRGDGGFVRALGSVIGSSSGSTAGVRVRTGGSYGGASPISSKVRRGVGVTGAGVVREGVEGVGLGLAFKFGSGMGAVLLGAAFMPQLPDAQLPSAHPPVPQPEPQLPQPPEHPHDEHPQGSQPHPGA